MSFLGVDKATCHHLGQILAGVPYERHLLPKIAWHLQIANQWTDGKNIPADDIRLMFVRAGRGTYTFDGTSYPISRHSVIFINRGTTFQHARDPDDPPYIIACRLELYDNATKKVVPSPAPPFHIAYQTSQASTLEPAFMMLVQAYQKRSDSCQYDLQAAATHSLLGCIRNELMAITQVVDPRIEQGRQFLADHPMVAIDWDTLAASVGMSRDYFCRCFTKALGTSPKSYHLGVKMEYAQFILETSTISVQELAERFGYSDAFAFSRQFKRSRGLSPSAVSKRSSR